MKTACVCLLILALVSGGATAQTAKAAARAAAPPRPKLVVAVVVDQLRADLLTRFQKDYQGGFAKLFREGAVFTDAHQEHFPTVTAAGHAALLSGAPPSVSGIIANEWFDREDGKRITSVEDRSQRLLGAEGPGASPRKLLVTTLGDELKLAGEGGKVIGISMKDRSAILPVGRMADAAYWFDNQSGNFVSSTWYHQELPAWVREFNEKRPADRYASQPWKAFDNPDKIYAVMPAAGEQLYSALERAPFGNDLVADFAIRAMTAENLGRGTGIDVLAVSFSSNDYVGHTLGPEAPEVRDITVRTDATLARLLAAIEKQVGLRNTLLVLTSDHGVAPSIRMSELHKIPGGRLRIVDVKKAADDALDARFGAADWVEYAGEFGLWLNSDAMEEKKLDPRLVEEVAARAVAELRDVFRTYTRTQLERSAPRDRVDERVFQGWNSKRSPDIVVVPDPFWIAHPTLMITHGAPFRYDSAVPLVFLSPLVKPGRYHRTAHVTDVAPTIATLLGILPPAGALGRVLDEMLR